MATKQTASKSREKASLNISFDSKDSKKASKKVSKLGTKVIAFALIFLIIGAGIGYGVCRVLTKNDCFDIVGKDEITLTIGERYTDQGVKTISFGKDVSSEIQITTNLTQENDEYYSDVEGTFYISYESTSIKYGKLFKLKRIRLITFVEPSEDDEIMEESNG